jgi:hypothetical protein
VEKLEVADQPFVKVGEEEKGDSEENWLKLSK